MESRSKSIFNTSPKFARIFRREKIFNLPQNLRERVESADCFRTCLKVTAWTDDGEIMGVRHHELDIEGVQFHPESILTEHGHAMLKNFLVRP